jgi:hypothetical protein
MEEIYIYGWVQDCGGDRGWDLRAICRKKAQHVSRNTCHVFQAEVYAILVCVHEIGTQDRPKKC